MLHGKYFLFLIMTCFLTFCHCNMNIHRALPGSPLHKRQKNYLSKNLQLKSDENFKVGINDLTTEEEEEETDESWDIYQQKKRFETPWLYAISAAILVGSTGVFPLLLFKSNPGHSLKDSVSPAHLKILLSFAVGGLLGDVFLHLLPEAWMFIEKDIKNHMGHFKVGIWVIVGFLCFLFIEKIFAEEEKVREFENKGKNKHLEYEQLFFQHDPVSKSNDTILDKKLCNEELRLRHHFGNCKIGDRDKNTSKEENKNISEEQGDFHKEQDENIFEEEDKNDEVYSEAKIKVIGYLNLLANCIDNFTHGLAVAGSFMVSIPVGLCTTLAILLHEIPHEIGDFAILLNAGFTRWDAAKGQFLTASGAVFGCVFGLFAEEAGDSSAWVLPFTSGGFLYIAMVTIVPDLQKEESLRASLLQITALFCGLFAMAFVSSLHH
ncbi:zinc transporter ZIP13 isoform X1 [Hydra vulgaris]|nr:zinc transporter ZIP13 [Hydra vulgaris]XP_012554329.1 zinc transporter ZIP13 [Hydra vulgaris]